MNVLVVPGVALSVWSSARLWFGRSARDWPVASGEIIESTVREGRGKSGRSFYMPRVQYRYTVGGREFTARRGTFGVLPPTFVVPSVAYAQLNGAAPGKRVAVHYHRWLPQLAVLRPGYTRDDLIAAASGLVLLLVGFLVRA